MGLLMTIDNGGTFTDACIIQKDQVVRSKTLTTPYDLTKCFVEVIKSASKELYGEENIRLLLSELEYLRYSTTAGTNAIVQRKGPRLGLILLDGIDYSYLTQSEEEKEMFAAMVDDRVVGVNAELEDYDLENHGVEVVNQLLSKGANRIVVCLSGPFLIKDEEKIKKIILSKYPRHLLGAVPVLFSHELVDDPNNSRRTWGALINAFLHSGMERFLYNAENFLRDYRVKNPMLIFHNDGNSARVAKTTAIKTYGSGPRGGMEGTKVLAKHYNIPALLTLDIGGTTSDIGLVHQGRIKEDIFGRIENIATSFSLTDLISIGAGGSSIFKVENGKVGVGPESVGAVPGPACFARGGEEPTITDAYLLMGILDSRSYFGGNMVLDEERAKAAILEKIANPLGITLEAALLRMEKAYEEKIAKGLAVYKDQVQEAVLLAFGGAGPMSACGVAREAGIKEVIVPRLAAIFSAFGISFSDVAHEYQVIIIEATKTAVGTQLSQLLERSKRDMYAEGFDFSECYVESSISYIRNGEHFIIPYILGGELPAGIKDGIDPRIHLRVVKPIEHYKLNAEKATSVCTSSTTQYQSIIGESGESINVPVYKFDEMTPGTNGMGPAIIEDQLFTCRVLDGWQFKINENRDIFLSVNGGTNQ
ncbi:MAG TPA: hydantoinase/oxoprolinase family protein [Bacillales bacterium]|nr:hydantoinase/oxoprolinase family protein [Bacillales bacterium]